jgi:hypothetical protein
MSMEFTDQRGMIHKINAKDAVARGLDFRRLALALYRYGVGDLTEYPAGNEYKRYYDPGQVPTVPTLGKDRERVRKFVSQVEAKLMDEAEGLT